jgi:hypothetical protein
MSGGIFRFERFHGVVAQDCDWINFKNFSTYSIVLIDKRNSVGSDVDIEYSVRLGKHYEYER